MKSSSVPRGCADLAPHLTALFDGEADSAQASEARAHLLVCPACSRLWLDWTQHRDTLQSEPVPPPPPTLLWRVLIAYRIAAFARPVRRRSRLPQVSATPLRGIEAPLPPRLSEHILARTTRKSAAHVLLTAPAPAAQPGPSPRWKARAFAFRRAPYLAVPALALWMLTLGRTEFIALLPAATDSALVAAPAVPPLASPADSIVTARVAVPNATAPALIPVAPTALASVVVSARRIASVSPAVAVSANRAPRARASSALVAAPITPAIARAPRTQRAVSARANRTNSGDGLGRVLLLAASAGRRDIERQSAISVPTRAPSVRAGVPAILPVSLGQNPVVSGLRARRRQAPPRVQSVARPAPEARVQLAALASPTSPIRTVSLARLRTATFSGEAMRPRVTRANAGGRRLARLTPEESAIPLRVSRPSAGAPTLREANFSATDNGPRLDELRSAVDDFRASVAGDE